MMGKPQEALAEFERCKPQTLRAEADIAFNMASALFKCGREQEALTQFRRTLEIRPDTAEAYANIGAILAAQGDTADAAEAFTAAFKLNPRDVENAHDLGVALLKLGRRREAKEKFRHVLTLRPGYEPTVRIVRRERM